MVQRYILLLITYIWVCPMVAQAKTCYPASQILSNTLPLEVVRELQSAQLWNFDYYDSPKTAAQQDEVESIKDFWRLLTTRAQTEQILTNMFGGINYRSTEKFFPSTYAVKVSVLRMTQDTPQIFGECVQPKWISQIYQIWMERYLLILNDLLSMAGISEYAKIQENLQVLLAQRRITIVDLSPALRTRYKQGHNRFHSFDLMTQDTLNKNFSVTGFFDPENKVIAIDFARNVSDTFVTYAHEIVHAADPLQQHYTNQIAQLADEAASVLTRWVGDGAAAKVWAHRILHQLYTETGLSDLEQNVTALLRARISELEQKNQQPTDLDLKLERTEEDRLKIRSFMRTAIGLTLENEFRAYALSLTAYINLKDKQKLLPMLPKRSPQIEALLKGDKLFASTLFARVGTNPFGEIRTEYNEGVNRIINSNMSATEKQKLILTVEKSLNILEQIYLSTIQEFISEQTNKYSAQIQKNRPLDAEIRSELPHYARPGGLNDPDNPYMPILAARMTTAWVLRFRTHVEQFASSLSTGNESLLTMSAGIIDLSGLSEVELRLVGVKYINSQFDRSNYKSSGEGKLTFQTNAHDIPPELKELFHLVSWDPRSTVLGSSEVLPKQEPLSALNLMTDLTRLRLLKTYKWLRLIFPEYQTILVRSLGFLNKLQEGQYNKDEISSDRAEELKNEIVKTLDVASQSREFQAKMKILLSSLAWTYNASSTQNWRTITEETIHQMDVLDSTLDVLRIPMKTTPQNIESQLQTDLTELKKSLTPHEEECRRSSLGPYEVKTQIATIAFASTNFTALSVCLNKNLKWLRRPRDSNLLLPTTLVVKTASGVYPTTYVEPGSRPILMDALPTPRTQR